MLLIDICVLRCFKSTVCLLSLMVVGILNSYADELVRHNVYDSYSRGTIIRHYRGVSDVICVHSGSHPYFMYLQEGVPTTYAMYVDLDTVCDFEIYNDTVYFCGYRRVNTSSVAVIGFFDLTTYPSPYSHMAYYLDLSWITDVRALEVDMFAARKHVVGVGGELRGNAMMVDLIDEGSFW